jgi:hypothetical protein
MMVETATVQVKAADASLPKRCHSPTRNQHGNRPGADPFFAYDANYLIDNKAGIILDAAGTRANRAVEIAARQTMIDRIEHRFDPRPRRPAGDTYESAGRVKGHGGQETAHHRLSA